MWRGTDSNANPRIVIVEDERIVARDLASTLVELDYEVVGMFTTGEELLAHVDELRADLVLMDIRIDGRIDGIETSALLHERADVPVIFLSAHSDLDTLQRANRTGPFAYVVKPFEATDLRCAIEIALHRHEIDARLREREHWLQTTLRSIGDGVIATDSTERVVYLNPVAEALTGWRQDEAVGKLLTDILQVVEEKTATEIESPVSRALRDGTVALLQGGSALVDRGGKTTPIDDSAAPIIDHGGKVHGGVMVFRDVTEQRRVDDEMKRLNAELEARVVDRTRQLEAANKELEAFSYSVAHDLRAPLRGIDGFSQALVEDHLAALGPDGIAHLKRIRACTERMSRLIDDLLRLARITQRELSLGRVDLSALVRATNEDLAALDQHRVNVHVAPNLHAWGDESLLRIVVENLLRNARKFTARTSAPTIDVGCEELAGENVFFMRDNGAGFEMAMASRLFGAFQRLHSDREFEGTGIGLAIVQRIIHRHGGRVWATGATGATGSGATFFFTLGVATSA